MKFTQIIEFSTSRIADFHDNLDAWMTKTAGDRIRHRAVLTSDRDVPNRYLLMVEFASHDLAMENSNRPATADFAAFLVGICEDGPTFRNLDVLREEDL